MPEDSTYLDEKEIIKYSWTSPQIYSVVPKYQ